METIEFFGYTFQLTRAYIMHKSLRVFVKRYYSY